jgi:uncharacterized protein YbjT (DUF2867 family)
MRVLVTDAAALLGEHLLQELQQHAYVPTIVFS